TEGDAGVYHTARFHGRSLRPLRRVAEVESHHLVRVDNRRCLLRFLSKRSRPGIREEAAAHHPAELEGAAQSACSAFNNAVLIFPVTGKPLSRWNAEIAARVLGPTIPSTGPV